MPNSIKANSFPKGVDLCQQFKELSSRLSPDKLRVVSFRVDNTAVMSLAKSECLRDFSLSYVSGSVNSE